MNCLGVLLVCSVAVLYPANNVAAVESGDSDYFSGDGGSGSGTGGSVCERLQQPLLPFCFESDSLQVREGDIVPLLLVPNDFQFDPFLQVFISLEPLTSGATAVSGVDFMLSDVVSRVESSQPFTVAMLEVVADNVTDDSYTETFQILVQVSYTDIEEQIVSVSTSLQVFIRDSEGVLGIVCPRDQICAVAGETTEEEDGRRVEVSGRVLTCSPAYIGDEISLDNTEIDQSFEAEFMSPGSLLLLQQLNIVESDEGTVPCNVSAQLQPHGDPTVALQRLGVEALSLVYLESEGSFNSLTLSLSELQSLVVSGDYSAEGSLDDTTSSSLHWLLYQLTQWPHLPPSTLCRYPPQAGSTVISFDINCT